MKTKRTSRPTRAVEKAMTARPLGKHILRLYVAGATDKSRQAVQRVHRMCDEELKDNCDLEVIDLYQQPALARDHQIVATPTLVVKFPPPMRRFIGNLSNIMGLFVKLDLGTNGKTAL